MEGAKWPRTRMFTLGLFHTSVSALRRLKEENQGKGAFRTRPKNEFFFYSSCEKIRNVNVIIINTRQHGNVVVSLTAGGFQVRPGAFLYALPSMCSGFLLQLKDMWIRSM